MQNPNEVRSALLKRVPAFAAKAADYFSKLDWKWFEVGGQEVPSRERLAEHCVRLIWDTWSEAEKHGLPAILSAGGVCVTILQMVSKAQPVYAGSLKLVVAEEQV